MDQLKQRENEILKSLSSLGVNLSPEEINEMRAHRRDWQRQTSPDARERLRLLNEFNSLEDAPVN